MPLGFKIPIIVISLLMVLLVLASVVPRVHYGFLSVQGKTYQCTVLAAMSAEGFGEDRKRRMTAIRASAQEIQSDENYTLWRTRDGDFWVPKRNADVLAFNLAEQEQDIYGRGINAVHAGEVVLDGGANVGVFTRKALDAGARTVIAIEPAPENVDVLRRNFSKEIANGRVVIEAVGLWNEPGELPLRIDANNSARNSFVLNYGPAASMVNIPLRTIDSLVESLALTNVDFIKLDIEGAEKKAIAGARQTMTRFRPRLAIATEHLNDDPVAIPAAINSLGLDYVTICGPCGRAAASVIPEALYFVPRSR